MFAVVMFATCLPVIWYVSYCHIATCLLLLLVHDAFIRTNRCTIAMMFVYLSICLSGTGVHWDHTVHFAQI